MSHEKKKNKCSKRKMKNDSNPPPPQKKRERNGKGKTKRKRKLEPHKRIPQKCCYCIGEHSRALVELICSDIDPAVREETNLRFQGERE